MNLLKLTTMMTFVDCPLHGGCVIQIGRYYVFLLFTHNSDMRYNVKEKF